MMQQFVWWSNIIGLFFSIVGSALLFIGSPRDTPDVPPIQPSSLDMYLYYKDLDFMAEYNKVQKRQKVSRIGILLVGIGFILQVASQLFQYPSRH